MDTQGNFCPTENPPRGRPPKPGRSVRITIRLREGEDDAILARLARVPKGRRSAYIRRVLAGAGVDVMDEVLAEEPEVVASLLDAMWEDEDW